MEDKKEELIKEGAEDAKNVKEEVKEGVVPGEVKEGVGPEEKKEGQPLPKKKTVRRELSGAAKARIRKVLNKEVDKRLNASIFILIGLFLFCIKHHLIDLAHNVYNGIIT